MDDLARDQRLAERLARAARAAQALSETLWEALREDLEEFRGERVPELCERLAELPATVGVLAPQDTLGSALTPTPKPAGTSTSTPTSAPAPASSPERRAEAAPRVLHGPAEELHGPAAERHEPATESGSRLRLPAEPPVPGEPPGHGPDPHAQRPERAPRGAAQAFTEPVGRDPAAVVVDELASAEIEVRDDRSERDARRAREPAAAPSEPPSATAFEPPSPVAFEPPFEPPFRESARAPWIASIERRLERYRDDHLPFAALVLELAGIERLRHAELPGELARLMGLVEAALARELRPADSLIRETPGRYWLLAPETDSEGARALATALALVVRRSASHRGAPLELAAGIAACPEDGERATRLAAQAEMALYAAQASGGRPEP